MSSISGFYPMTQFSKFPSKNKACVILQSNSSRLTLYKWSCLQAFICLLAK